MLSFKAAVIFSIVAFVICTTKWPSDQRFVHDIRVRCKGGPVNPEGIVELREEDTTDSDDLIERALTHNLQVHFDMSDGDQEAKSFMWFDHHFNHEVSDGLFFPNVELYYMFYNICYPGQIERRDDVLEGIYDLTPKYEKPYGWFDFAKK